MRTRDSNHNLPSREVTIGQVRDTGLAMVLLALLGAWFSHRWGLTAVAVVLLLACMVRPALFRPLAGPWFAFSHRLGTVSSAIILSVLFSLVVTPVGILRRWLGADPMLSRRWKDGTGSVFRERADRFRPEDLENPY